MIDYSYFFYLAAPLNKDRDQVIQTFDQYSEDDDTITDTSRTLSSVADHHDSPPFINVNEDGESISFIEKMMKDPDNGRVSRYQNTYFMDGGNRFISVSINK